MPNNSEQTPSYQPEDDDGDVEFVVSSEDFKSPEDSLHDGGAEKTDGSNMTEGVAELFNDIRVNGEVGMSIRDNSPEDEMADSYDADRKHVKKVESDTMDATNNTNKSLQNNMSSASPNPDKHKTQSELKSPQEDLESFSIDLESASDFSELSDCLLGNNSFPDNLPEGLQHNYSEIPDTISELKQMWNDDKALLLDYKESKGNGFSEQDYFHWENVIFFNIERMARELILEQGEREKLQALRELQDEFQDKPLKFFAAQEDIDDLIRAVENNQDLSKKLEDIEEKYKRLNKLMQFVINRKNSGEEIPGAYLGEKNTDEDYIVQGINIPSRRVNIRGKETGEKVAVDLKRFVNAYLQYSEKLKQRPFNQFDLRDRVEDNVDFESIWDEVDSAGLYLAAAGNCFVKGESEWSQYSSFKAYQDEINSELIDKNIDEQRVQSVLKEDIAGLKEEIENEKKVEQEALKQARNIKDKARNNLIKGPRGEFWNMGAIENQTPTPHVALYEADNSTAKRNKVPLVTEQGALFAERYSPITDPQRAQEIISSGSSNPNKEAPENTRGGGRDNKKEKTDVGFREKQSDESLFSYAYNRVSDEQREVLKQVKNELTDSEYEGIERLQKKLAEDPAKVLRLISGIESGQARTEKFPKYEVLQTLGAIERINRQVVSKDDVRSMVAAGYDSEWDVWQRVKANHAYERQDGTVFANLSGDKHGLWSKFADRQAYEAYKDPEKEAQPIGRKRGIGDMLEYVRKDIETIKSELSVESTKETEDHSIESGDTVVLTEGGKKHTVAAVGEVNEQTIILLEDGRPKRIDEITKLDVGTGVESQTSEENKAESKTMNETSQNIEVLSHKEILDVIHSSESVEEAVRRILENERVYWNEDQYAYQKESGEWAVYSETTEKDIDGFSQAEMKQKMRDAVVELNESVRLKIDNFVDGVLTSVDKIITAIENKPTDESVQDEIEFKQEYQTLRNKIVSQNDLLSRQEIKRYRDRFVKLMHWYKHKRPELWHRSEAVYRTDVRETVVEIDQILDNS